MGINQSTRIFPIKTILLAGCLVGTLDILSACIDYYIATGKEPSGIFRYIASGVFGEAAFTGNSGMIVAGLLFHYIIAFTFTFFFFWLYAASTLNTWNPVLTAFVYGIFIWIAMNLGVVRLSRVNSAPLSAMQPAKVIKSYLILVFMIGIPLSLIANRYSRVKEEH